MIRLAAVALTLGVILATATTVTAQAQGECWWAGCNPEADLCRLLCGSDDPQQTEIGRQWQAPYASAYPRYQYHRHVKHHHKTPHYSG
jgi:hypothetical protein